MTKKQLKEKYQDWNKNISQKYLNRKTELFHKMQDLASENNIPKYCSMEMLLECLIKENQTFRALRIYNEYISIEAQMESLKELAIATDNFNIGGKLNEN